MTAKEAIKAIENNEIVCFVDEPEKWGTLTHLDDDSLNAYYKPRGCQYPIGVTINNLRLDKPAQK